LFSSLLDGAKDKESFIEECQNAELSSVGAESLDDLSKKINDEYNKLLSVFQERHNVVVVLSDFIDMFSNKKATGKNNKDFGVTLPERYKDFKPSDSLFTKERDYTSTSRQLVYKYKLMNEKKIDAYIKNNSVIDGNMFVAVVAKFIKLEGKDYMFDLTDFLLSGGKTISLVSTKETLDYEVALADKEINEATKRSEYEIMKKNILRQLCLKHRYEAIIYNCQLRVIEGTMINHSLSEFRRDIKNIILHSLKTKNGGILPFMYDENIATYCRNLYMMSDYYKTFDAPLEGNVNDLKLGEIFKIIKDDYEVDLSKLNFGIFTIINLSDSTSKTDKNNATATNNPPTPPYINLAGLLYQLPIQFGGMSIFKQNKTGKQRENVTQKREIIKTYTSLLNDTIAGYEFYRTNADLLLLKESLSSLIIEETDYESIHQKFIEPFIKIINSNNPSTLIGSLQGTQELVRPASSMVIPSFNKYLYDKQPTLFKRGDAKIEIVYGSNASSAIVTDEAFEKTLKFKGHNLL